MFDNESAGIAQFPTSRVDTIQLNQSYARRDAGLLRSTNPRDSSQRLRATLRPQINGDLFVGWGALPYFSEFSPTGQLVFNAAFPTRA